jgi:hypothetical protein
MEIDQDDNIYLFRRDMSVCVGWCMAVAVSVSVSVSAQTRCASIQKRKSRTDAKLLTMWSMYQNNASTSLCSHTTCVDTKVKDSHVMSMPVTFVDTILKLSTDGTCISRVQLLYPRYLH